MKVTRISAFTGNTNTMDLNVTADQMECFSKGDVLIQQVFPNLNSSEREFIKSGVTPEEWDDVFGSEE